MEGPGQYAVAHRHHHLDHAGHTGGGLCVTDVGLEGAQPQRVALGPVPAVCGEYRVCLDRVAQRRPRAVGLHDVHVGRGETGVGQGLPDDPLLGRPVGGCQSVARTVLVDRGAAHDGQDGVSVAAGVGQPLDEQEPCSLGPAGAAGGGREGTASAVRGEPSLAGELHEAVRCGHDGHSAGHRQVAFAGTQCLGGHVEGDQRGGASGVHRDGGAFEAEGVGDPAGQHAGRVAGDEVSLGSSSGRALPRAVVLVHGTDEDTRPAAVQGGGVDACPLDHFPGRLQQDALLRVHGQRLARRYPEEGGVEVPGVVQEAAVAHVGLPGLPGVRVEEAVDVPAAVGGKVGHRVAAARDEVPQVFRRGDSARQPGTHGDDHDRVVVACRTGDGGRGGVLFPQEQAAQMGGEGGGGGVVEDDRGRQRDAGLGGQTVTQVQRGHGVEALVTEGAVRVHRVRP